MFGNILIRVQQGIWSILKSEILRSLNWGLNLIIRVKLLTYIPNAPDTKNYSRYLQVFISGAKGLGEGIIPFSRQIHVLQSEQDLFQRFIPGAPWLGSLWRCRSHHLPHPGQVRLMFNHIHHQCFPSSDET